MAVNMFGIEPEVFRIFSYWTAIVFFKMVAVIFMTIRYRFLKMIFLNPDDPPYVKGGKVTPDPDIDRVRRCHLNDLENIPPWFIVTFLWLTTNPSAQLAGILIRTFVISRIVHTFSYAVVSKQPHRLVSYAVGLTVTVFQALCILIYYS
ncbi:microsomal glutathione S-transferase 1-like [Lasioglossum baleicum]|uniref:microsomal glutathione S-transferase 1-like n=1 Tax=Lasioglossum baleicum TaxID=434251 RepID=UPI003FCDAC28